MSIASLVAQLLLALNIHTAEPPRVHTQIIFDGLTRIVRAEPAKKIPDSREKTLNPPLETISHEQAQNDPDPGLRQAYLDARLDLNNPYAKFVYAPERFNIDPPKSSSIEDRINYAGQQFDMSINIADIGKRKKQTVYVSGEAFEKLSFGVFYTMLVYHSALADISYSGITVGDVTLNDEEMGKLTNYTISLLLNVSAYSTTARMLEKNGNTGHVLYASLMKRLKRTYNTLNDVHTGLNASSTRGFEKMVISLYLGALEKGFGLRGGFIT